MNYSSLFFYDITTKTYIFYESLWFRYWKSIRKSTLYNVLHKSVLISLEGTTNYLDNRSVFIMYPLKGHSNIKYISCALILDLKSQLDIYNASGQDGTSKHTRM